MKTIEKGIQPQPTAYASPWSLRQRVLELAWQGAWELLCAWTPKPLNPWRLVVLKLFGATIQGTPFVHQRARIQQPWNLELHHRACLGDRANAYSLGRITIQEGATVAQEVYLCTGSHDFSLPHLPLVVAPIVIGPFAFIGARAFILPGVSIGAHSVVGAMSLVSRDVVAGTTVAGNPARSIRSSRP
jgi:putative colanic acid biosynthesis acetyltransferase WcaF